MKFLESLEAATDGRQKTELYMQQFMGSVVIQAAIRRAIASQVLTRLKADAIEVAEMNEQPVQPDAKEEVEKKEKEEVEKKAKVEAGLALIRVDEAYAEAERLKAEADRLKDYADKAHGYFIKVNNIKPGFGRLAKEKADEAYAKAERLKVEADEAYAEAERLKVEAADAAETALA